MEIIQVSGLLKTSASTGIDDINLSIATSTIATIATPLIGIINSYFNWGQVPDCMKIAKITPRGHFNLVIISLLLIIGQFQSYLFLKDLREAHG